MPGAARQASPSATGPGPSGPVTAPSHAARAVRGGSPCGGVAPHGGGAGVHAASGPRERPPEVTVLPAVAVQRVTGLSISRFGRRVMPTRVVSSEPGTCSKRNFVASAAAIRLSWAIEK